jgi:hypothetical protein
MRPVLIALAVALAATGSAHAQVFASGAAFGDIKRFSGDPSNSTLDGTTFGGGARVGMFVAPRWSVEVGIDAGALTTKTRSLSIGVLGPPIPIGIAPPNFSFQSRTSNRFIATSVMLGYRPATTGRVHPEFLGGLTFAHFTRTFDTSGPTPLASRLVWSAAPTLPSELLYSAQPLVIRPHAQVDNVPAAALGFNLALDLARHLALVPEVRAHAFSLNSGGPSAFVLRPGLAVRWMF